MEGSPREERFALRSFEEDPTDHGFMTYHRAEPLALERTADNDHFFHWNNAAGRFELNYTGSAEIVHMLDLHMLADARLQEQSRPPRAISLYDTSGNFHDSVIVHDVALIKGGSSGPKHVAVFLPAMEDGSPFPLLIDDIYCLGLPLSRHEGSLMTEHVLAEDSEEDS